MSPTSGASQPTQKLPPLPSCPSGPSDSKPFDAVLSEWESIHPPVRSSAVRHSSRSPSPNLNPNPTPMEALRDVDEVISAPPSPTIQAFKVNEPLRTPTTSRSPSPSHSRKALDPPIRRHSKGKLTSDTASGGWVATHVPHPNPASISYVSMESPPLPRPRPKFSILRCLFRLICCVSGGD